MKPRREGEPLRIVCTDDGRHSPAQLADYWHMVNGDPRLTSEFNDKWPTVIGPGTHELYEPNEATERFSTDSYEFRCPRCGRNPKRNADWLEDILAMVYDSKQLDRFDISKALT